MFVLSFFDMKFKMANIVLSIICPFDMNFKNDNIGFDVVLNKTINFTTLILSYLVQGVEMIVMYF